ncbi:MAG: substrate-binding domain-containing protein [Verrucomicrobia bacterium]|nr:substrate-binding domain-containing protein [Verrucomicrobiota bacterium]
MKDDGKTGPRSLMRQSADLIRERIETGQFGPTLPGENELARILDVSRPTIRGALDLLEREEVVAAASTGVAREVRKNWFGRKKAGPLVRFLLAAPLHERSAGFQAGMRQMRERLASHGADVAFQVSAAFRTSRPGRILAKETAGGDCDVWVVVDATPEIEAWLETRQLPCVCVGGSYRHHLPRTGGDGDQAIRDAAKSLLVLGHRRIVYPLHNAYGVQMVATLCAVLQEHGVEWDEAFHVPHWKDHAANFFPMLARMFASTKPPTAFLTLGVRNLLPVLTWLGHHGLRVPEDVSLISMIDDPLLEFLYPPITSYILDRDKLCHIAVDMALRVVQSGKPFDQARMIPMRRIEGRSTGSAQGRGALP